MSKILDYTIIIKSNGNIVCEDKCSLSNIRTYFNDSKYSSLENVEVIVNDNTFDHIPNDCELYQLNVNNPRLLRDLLSLLKDNDFIERIDFDVNDWQSKGLGGEIFLYNPIEYYKELSTVADKIEALYNFGSSGDSEADDYRRVCVMHRGSIDNTFKYYKGVDF